MTWESFALGLLTCVLACVGLIALGYEYTRRR